MSNKVQKVPRAISPELAELKKEIGQMQSKGVQVSSDLLEKTKLRDIGQIEDTISNAMHLLGKMAVKKDGKATGIMKSILNSIPFSGKIMKKVDQAVIENKSMKESVDEMHNAIDDALSTMNDDLESLIQISEHIGNSLDSGREKEEVLKSFIEKAQEDNRRLDAVQAKRLYIQLKAINLSNQEAVNGLDMQIKSSDAMASVLGEILPVLKPTLLQQSAIAVANMNNERVVKTTQVVSQVLNEIIIANKESSQETIKETIKLSNKKIIEAKTIKTLDDLDNVFRKDIKQLAVQLVKDNNDYEKVLTASSNRLLSQNNDVLLQLDSASSDEDVH